MSSSASPTPDDLLRAAAFDAIRKLTVRHGAVLPWNVIAAGFQSRGQSVLFANRARGIFRPKALQDQVPLSIKTTFPDVNKGRTRRYADLATVGAFVYRYQDRDEAAFDNVWLQNACVMRTPMIYFYGDAPARYAPLWPAFIEDFNDASASCHVVIGDPAEGAVSPESTRSTDRAKMLLDDGLFRLQVLAAWDERCAVCRLDVPRLLDASAIVPARRVRGDIDVRNGLSLCALHREAFTADLLAVAPDRAVHIAERLRKPTAGPVFESLGRWHGQPIVTPDDPDLWPREDLLAERFERFRLVA